MLCESGEASVPVTLDHLKALLKGPWAAWKQNTTQPEAKKARSKPLAPVVEDLTRSVQWLSTVGMGNVLVAEQKLLTELQDFETFDPYTQGESGNRRHFTTH